MFLFAGKSKEEKGRKGEGMGKKFYPIGKYTPAMLLSVKNFVSKLLKLQNLQRSFIRGWAIVTIFGTITYKLINQYL